MANLDILKQKIWHGIGVRNLYAMRVIWSLRKAFEKSALLAVRKLTKKTMFEARQFPDGKFHASSKIERMKLEL